MMNEQMTDRELLELAAEAADLKLTVWSDRITDYDSPHYGSPALHEEGTGGQCGSWNPLIDHGEAFRLAVKLGICPACDGKRAYAMISFEKVFWCDVAEVKNDPYAATCRAIVRAAAEIGKERR